MSDRYDVEFDDKKEEYRMVVIRLKNGPSHRCGYVSVPEEHPFNGKDYHHKIDFDCKNAPVNTTDPIGTMIAALNASEDDSKMEISYAANVHGGITYSGASDSYPVEGNKWWFGFDAGHCYDDYDGGQPLEYMKEQCEKLKAFLKTYAK